MIKIKNYYWPDDVGTKYKASLTRVKSLYYVCACCKAANRTNLVVQAGGSIGVWPRILSKEFTQVITCEPEPISFACLYKNVPDQTVIKLPVALGDQGGLISIKRNSLTAHKVNTELPGTIPMITIDSLNLPVCDAILLDVESFEFQVLCGAMQTISEFHPFILVETEKDDSAVFSIDDPVQKVRTLLSTIGYKKIAHVELDDIYEYKN